MSMRITNKIIGENSLYNINNNKTQLDKLTRQMSTGKKISRASEDPIVAIRALRIKNSLNEIQQYNDKNIKDADSWMTATQTALGNVYTCTESMLTQMTSLSTTTYSTSQKQSIIENLESLKQQVYAEGNANYSGRSLLTGYRTNLDLAFSKDNTSSSYRITENLSGRDVVSSQYVSGQINLDKSAVLTAGDAYDSSNLDLHTLHRIRLAYNGLSANATLSDSAATSLGITVSTKAEGTNTITIPTADNVSPANAVSIKITVDSSTIPAGISCTDSAGGALSADYVVDTSTPGTINITNAVNGVSVSANYAITGSEVTLSTKIPVSVTPLSAGSDNAYLPSNGTVNYIPDTGELILGDGVYQVLQTTGSSSMQFSYEKTGFKEGDLHPEHYFDCVDITDAANPIAYTNDGVSQDISYDVNFNQSIVVNTQAKNVFDHSIARDIDDMITTISDLTTVETTISDIKSMLQDKQYANHADYLNSMLTAAKEQQTYMQEKLTSLAGSYITVFTQYNSQINTAITDLASRQNRLDLVADRVSGSVTNLKTLQSDNGSVEISDVYIQQSAATTAYTAALTAASKLTQKSLLDFL